jgi:integrase
MYFARVRVHGKLLRQSLKTTDLTTAKRDLGKLEDRLRNQGVRNGKMKFAEALKTHQQRINADQELKPRTKAYYEERIKALRLSWPDLESTEIRKFTENDLVKWADKQKPEMSGSAFNHTLGLLRAVFAVGIKNGARFDNPAMAVERASERQKRLKLPEPGQFGRFVAEIESSGSGFSKPCANLVRFLAYGGFRLNEAKFITWADCDFKLGKITVRGSETGLKGRKADEVRFVPMIPDMRALLEKLKADRPLDLPAARVMQVHECQKAMDRAAKEVKMHRITHHDLRHLFATICIESGVDIPTVSRWLGHRDGGALAMRVYGHLRDEHSVSMAQKVSFSGTVPKPLIANTP